MANNERWDAGTLVLWFVVTCSGSGAVANVQGGVSAAAVRGVEMFAVAVAAFGVAIAVGGGIGVEGAGDISGAITAVDVGISIVGVGSPDGAGLSLAMLLFALLSGLLLLSLVVVLRVKAILTNVLLLLLLSAALVLNI